MKKTIKLLCAILAATMLFALLCACGSAANVPVDELVKKVDEATGKGDSLVAVDASYIKGYLKMDVENYEGYAVKINAYGANIDEYGIFKAKDGNQLKDIKAAVEGYFQMRKDAWMDEYMPEEKPKLSSAEVKVAGNYVMYCILGDSDKTAAFNAFTEALK